MSGYLCSGMCRFSGSCVAECACVQDVVQPDGCVLQQREYVFRKLCSRVCIVFRKFRSSAAEGVCVCVQEVV